MARIYKLSRAGLHLIQKVRRHRGHGIHSPFVFNLVNNVIEEKNPYYKYDDIKEYLLSCTNIPYKADKQNELSFKLINYFGAKNILEIGAGRGINTLYLTAASTKIICYSVETDSIKYEQARSLYTSGWDRTIIQATNIPDTLRDKQDCVYINLKNFRGLSDDTIDWISTLIHPESFIIVKGIRTNKKNKLLWNKIKKMNGRTVVLDLFNVGIIFFNPKLYCWEYKISF